MYQVIAYLKDESGASAAEYALILGIIAVAIVTALGLLSTAIQGAINTAATAITTG
jgi:pilus assembly protein Flp/PilA